jgi:hypothetical protein
MTGGVVHKIHALCTMMARALHIAEVVTLLVTEWFHHIVADWLWCHA